MYRIAALTLITLLLGACATIPGPLEGKYSPVTPNQARQRIGIGEQVRWGGSIVSVKPLEQRTCIEILGNELNESARPYGEDFGQGRFIACKAGFLDPAHFEKEQEVTVIGRITGVDTRLIGEYEYQYPVLDTQVLYIWPERDESRRYAYRYHPFLYDPFFWPYAIYRPYWGYLLRP